MRLPTALQRPFRRARPEPAPSPDASLPPLASTARSHIGCVRTINEDRVFDAPSRGLWAVADGMGGHAAGDIAAETVVAALQKLADGARPITDATVESALVRVNRALHAGGSARVSGATVVALHLAGRDATILWAGDSRAYRWRAGELDRLTHDHSLVQELIDAGDLDPALADRHPQAHVVTRALGAAAEVRIERRTVSIADGDIILLCSDGLARGSADPALDAYADRPIGAIAGALIADALAAGGADNASLVLIRIG